MGPETRKEASSLLAKALGAELNLEGSVAVKPEPVRTKPPDKAKLGRMPRANAGASLFGKGLDG